MTICTLTNQAKEQISRICDENSVYAVSLNLKGGGCAGFEYNWDVVENKEDISPGDVEIDAGQGKLVIGAVSLMFLAGTEIDYVKSIVGSKFDIKNPNAQSSCGCGVSVDFDMNKLSATTDNNSEALAYPIK